MRVWKLRAREPETSEMPEAIFVTGRRAKARAVRPARLVDLHSRVHCGAYRAQPSRRVYIPKPDGRLTAARGRGAGGLGCCVWQYRNQLFQQAMVTILNRIYEADFRG